MAYEDNCTIQLVFAICYELWTLRNKRCFDGITLPSPEMVSQRACAAVSSFNDASNFLQNQSYLPIPMPHSAVRWLPPCPGHYKLNVDAAGPDESGSWGLAAVVQDSNGVVMTAACWYHLSLPNSDAAEGLTMLLGVKFC